MKARNPRNANGLGVMVGDETVDELPPESVDPVEMTIDAGSVLGYASIQNDVPIVRRLTIQNVSSEVLAPVEVRLSCAPGFAEGFRKVYERLEPGEKRVYEAVDLRPNHEYLANLNEAVRGQLVVSAFSGEHKVGGSHQAVTVLSYDQWAASQSFLELLAAFSQPNAPVIDGLNASASKVLRERYPSSALNGYQSKDREGVWNQVSAIYSTLAALDIQYAEPPASFGVSGQKIRTPERLIGGRLGTCLDLVMLFVSCLEQAGLHSMVLLKEGHAWVGVWLTPTSFPNHVVDDVISVRKRVKTGELLVFETTVIANKNKSTLRSAMAFGKNHLDEEGSFRYAIDIKRCREIGIKPLPSKEASIARSVTPEDVAVPVVEDMPELPPLDELARPIHGEVDEQTPEGRLAKWKSKLLDLTLRNRLLNFKPTKSNVRLVIPDLGKFEDLLAEGTEFKVRGQPKVMEGGDPRSAELHTARTAQRPLNETAAEMLPRGDLLATLDEAQIDGRLLEIFTAARTGLEEGGANVLFVSIGMLSWLDEAKAKTPHLAPLLMLPVTLDRTSVRSGFRLRRHDDEVIVNPTLLQLLRQNYALNISGIDPLPTDGHGVDVIKLLQQFRLAINDLKGWEVLDQVHIGIFSFTKFLMWKDLQDRVADLTQNRVVSHLVNNPGHAFAVEKLDFNPRNLDAERPPHEIFAPMLLDSSQLSALCVASDGHDMVIEGPPGTGKSQTITNLIAHFLATKKSVLFVSEKMAALEVVHRRLKSIGLGAFCLELHSSKATKSEVVQQLGQALDFDRVRSPEEWRREAETLASLRRELNEVVDALHKAHPNGLTVHEALGTVIKYREWEASPLPWGHADAVNRDELDKLRLTSRKLETALQQVGQIVAHPLGSVLKSEWSPGWQDELLEAGALLGKTVAALRTSLEPMVKLLALPDTGHALHHLEAYDRLAAVLLAAPRVPAGLARSASDSTVRAKIESLRKHGEQRKKVWGELGDRYSADATRIDPAPLEVQWRKAEASWWLMALMGKRKVTGQLALYTTNKKRTADVNVADDLKNLELVRKEDSVLEAMRPEAEVLLSSDYQGLETDWDAVHRHELWTQDYNKALALITLGDSAHFAALNAKLQGLVGENRALLAPGGQVATMLVAFRDAYRRFLDAAGQAGVVSSNADSFPGDKAAGDVLGRLSALMQGWRLHSRHLNSWCLWRRTRETALNQGLYSFISMIECGAVPIASIPKFFEYSFQSWWVKKVFDREPVLHQFASVDHERKIGEFRAADARFQKLTERQIVAELAANVPAATSIAPSDKSELGVLRRELSRQRGHTPVRQLIKGLPTLLPRLKPCLLMSPLSVAQYLSADHQKFDVVIFDEASQIPVWDAVGAIARGKQVIVVGDPKQLPPTNFFQKSNDSDNESGAEEEVEDLESILDECLGSGLRRFRLKWHYRSRHESLITFSNLNYYDGELITFPSPVTEDRGVEYVKVSGVYDRGASRTCKAEAEAVVEAIKKHFLDPTKRDKTVGVVTFNQPQQQLIANLLDAARKADHELDLLIAEAKFEPLFLKNLENVQGDERDLIFFSTTYGQDAAGRMTMNFGPLNLEGGHRRLNVAISRAREGVKIFSILSPDQIDASRVRARGVLDFKSYLEFVIRGPRALVEASNPTGLGADSPFEVAVIEALRNKGWQVHSQVGCSGYRIDIGVVDPRAPGRYLIGVECDGKTYHSAATARDRDRLRQSILEQLGWTIHRIWSTDWWIDPDNQIRQLNDRLEALILAEEDDAKNTTSDPQSAHTELDVEIAEPAEIFRQGFAPGVEPESIQVRHSIFTPVAMPAGAMKDDFYGSRAASSIQALMLDVIAGEGPISEGELFPRIARVWGLERTGSRIVDRLKQLVPKVPITRDAGEKFYWPEYANPKEYSGFRISDGGESSRRNVSKVALQEIGNIAMHSLHEFGATPEEDLAKSVCRLLGMNRTTADAEQRVRRAIANLEASGRIAMEGGLVVPKAAQGNNGC